MFRIGVVMTAVSILFLLTVLAMTSSGRLRHPYRATAALAALLVAGVALLRD
jgi:cytochrome bd-type quinol oxidase subunit 2